MPDEGWLKQPCPHCDRANWFPTGDTEDCTSSVGEEPVAQCWRCHRRWWRSEDAILRQHEFQMGGWDHVYPSLGAWFDSEDVPTLIGRRSPVQEEEDKDERA